MLDRRLLLAPPALAALPRLAVAQADQRPVMTIAVQKVSNTNTLETLREQSNVGSRTWNSYAETLIEQIWTGDLPLAPQPGHAFVTDFRNRNCGA
jgi:peptide/nickel transport system substrate-binding protein